MNAAFRRAPGTTLLLAATILLAGWLAFGGSIRGGWVWDDTEEVTQNTVMRDPAGLPKIWFAPDGTDYLPLKTSVQWLEWRAWGSDPAGYHAVNLALHLLSALLFWRVLGKLGLRHAWIGGLLLAVHPLAVESVAWVAELKNTLSLALLLLAMLAYLDYDDFRGAKGNGVDPSLSGMDSGPTLYLLSLCCFLFAMLSKSSVVMFPLVILLYAWWKRGRIGRRDWLGSAPFFAISLGLGLVTVWFQHHRAIVAGHQFAGGIFERVAAAGLALAFYLGKCLWPFGLLPIYPRWEINPASPLAYLPWLALAAVVAWCWSLRQTWGRPILFGLGFFGLNLAPVLGLVAMAYLRISRVADHFAYLSLLGILALVVAGADQLLARRSRAVATWAGLAAVVAVLTWQSHRYTEIFHDEETLWSYTVKRNPAAWVAQGNLGYVIFQQGRVPEAVPYYREALRLNPDYAEAHYNLGTALLQLNQVPEAIAEYEQAVRLLPTSAGIQNNLGMALVRAGRLPDAVGHFAQAVRLDPDYGEAHHNFGNALLLTGRFPEAIRQYQEVLRLDPHDAAARSGLEMAQRAWQGGSPSTQR
jgi:tetratricopeptide (TPR) repeat protein